MSGLGLAYTGLFICALLASRIGLVAGRGGIQPRTLPSALLGFAAMVATFSLFVWGFAVLKWYWPVGAFLSGSIVAGLLVSRSAFPMWLAIAPALQILTVVGATYLWGWYWPF